MTCLGVFYMLYDVMYTIAFVNLLYAYRDSSVVILEYAVYDLIDIVYFCTLRELGSFFNV